MTAVEFLFDAVYRDMSYPELLGIIAQAKIIEKQQKKMYSEEEVIKILYQFHYDLVNSNFDTKEEWFEEFKKNNKKLVKLNNN